MTRFLAAWISALTILGSTVAVAEERSYGEVHLTGLAEHDWPLNPPGYSFAMVCNVNDPDSFLSVRKNPGTSYPVVRSFEIGRLGGGHPTKTRAMGESR